MVARHGIRRFPLVLARRFVASLIAVIGLMGLTTLSMAPSRLWGQAPVADAPPQASDVESGRGSRADTETDDLPVAGPDQPTAPEITPGSIPPGSDAAPAVETQPDDSVPVPMTSTEDEEYFELLKLFADTLDQVERNYVKEVDRRELMEAAIEGLLAKLDQYSDYITPEHLDTFRRDVESEFGGIGIRVGNIDGQLVVVTPLLNTPAYRAGLQAGDLLLKIGDEDASTMSLEQAIERMKGKIGSSISLTVRHGADGKEEQHSIQREMVQVETVFGYERRPDDQWEFMLDGEHKIGYIRISTFSRHTADDLKAALDQLAARGVRGLILDLRFDPGGLFSTALEVADRFLTEGIIVSTAGRNTIERTWSATQPGTFADCPMVVLVNGYSASASEIVAAALQDHGRAVVIGQRTWGKGSVQNIIELEGGRSALKLTTAGYRRPSGKNIHRFEGATDEDDWGVRPDAGFDVDLSPRETRQLLAFHRDRDIIATPEQREANPVEPFVDRQLQKGIDHLREKLGKP